jgi:hypothetical protein
VPGRAATRAAAARPFPETIPDHSGKIRQREAADASRLYRSAGKKCSETKIHNLNRKAAIDKIFAFEQYDSALPVRRGQQQTTGGW